MADELVDLGYEVYASQFSKLFNELYDLTIKHYLRIHAIQNDAIVSGKTRDEVLKATDVYIESVVPK